MVAALTPITSASGKGSYYGSENYYAKDDPEQKRNSLWYGEGASALGLAGKTVDPDVFETILEGRIDKDTRVGRVRDGAFEHRPGDDLTLTVPKSVSIQALVYQDKAVLDSHKEAVLKTLDFVERNFIETRSYNPDTKRMQRAPTGNMVAATYLHDLSRLHEPNLHTHAVIANITQGMDGKWRSTERTTMRHNIKLIGAYFHNELVTNLEKRGYETTPRMLGGTLSGFELSGYDSKMLEEFSTRRQDMLDYLEERNLPYTPKTAQIAALATRPDKTEVDRNILQQEWRGKATELGIDSVARHHRRRKYNYDANKDNVDIFGAIRTALDDIQCRNTVFTLSELQAHVLGQLLGRVTLEAVNEKIAMLESDGHLIPAQRRGVGQYYVTIEAVKTEKRIIDFMKNGRGQVQPVRPEHSENIHNEALTEGQNNALNAILTSGDKVMGIEGYAGTGKTTMLKTLGQNSYNHQVIGLAPSVAATRILANEAEVPARTLQSFLTKFDEIDKMDKGTLAARQKTFAKSILVLDESSMVSTKQMDKFFGITGKLEIQHIILVGDSKQLRSVEAGQPFRQLQQHGMQTEVMKDIIRQKDDLLKKSVEAMLDGQPARAMEGMGQNLIEVEELGIEAAKLWLNLDKEARDDTLILAPTHELRAEIHGEIRGALQSEGVLTGKVLFHERLINTHMTGNQKAEPHFYDKGDVLAFHKAATVGIKVGDHLTVTGVSDDGKLLLVDDDGNQKQMNPNTNNRYCYGVYQSQPIELQAGDKVRFTRNDHQKNIANGDVAVIDKIGSRAVHFTDSYGESFSLKRSSHTLKHIDHGYSSTVYGAQGMTSERVIAVLDSGQGELTNQQSFYVEISRAKTEAIVLTNNIEQLSETLEANTGEKLSAFEALGNFGLQSGRDDDAMTHQDIELALGPESIEADKEPVKLRFGQASLAEMETLWNDGGLPENIQDYDTAEAQEYIRDFESEHGEEEKHHEEYEIEPEAESKAEQGNEYDKEPEAAPEKELEKEPEKDRSIEKSRDFELEF